MSLGKCRECGGRVHSKTTCPQCGIKHPTEDISSQWLFEKFVLWGMFIVVLVGLWLTCKDSGTFIPAITKQDQSTTPRQNAKTDADILPPPSPELLACIDHTLGQLNGNFFMPTDDKVEAQEDGTLKLVYISAGNIFKRWLWGYCTPQAKAWIVNECEPRSHSSSAVCELYLNVFASDEFERLGFEMVSVTQPGWRKMGLKAVRKGSYKNGVPLWRAMKMTNAIPFIFEEEAEDVR